MDTLELMPQATDSYTLKDAAEVFFSQLDEGIEDYENGRVISSEELWEEIDAI